MDTPPPGFRVSSRHQQPGFDASFQRKGLSGVGVVAQAVSQLRLAGVNGTYALVWVRSRILPLAERTDDGYPVPAHIQRLVDGKIIWAPAIEGRRRATTRGGVF